MTTWSIVAGRHARRPRRLVRRADGGHHPVVPAVEVTGQLQDLGAAGEGARDAHGQVRGLGARHREARQLARSGISWLTSSAHRTSAAWQAPMWVPRAICSCTAFTTAGWQWPRKSEPWPIQ